MNKYIEAIRKRMFDSIPFVFTSAMKLKFMEDEDLIKYYAEQLVLNQSYRDEDGKFLYKNKDLFDEVLFFNNICDIMNYEKYKVGYTKNSKNRYRFKVNFGRWKKW